MRLRLAAGIGSGRDGTRRLKCPMVIPCVRARDLGRELGAFRAGRELPSESTAQSDSPLLRPASRPGAWRRSRHRNELPAAAGSVPVHPVRWPDPIRLPAASHCACRAPALPGFLPLDSNGTCNNARPAPVGCAVRRSPRPRAVSGGAAARNPGTNNSQPTHRGSNLANIRVTGRMSCRVQHRGGKAARAERTSVKSSSRAQALPSW